MGRTTGLGAAHRSRMGEAKNGKCETQGANTANQQGVQSELCVSVRQEHLKSVSWQPKAASKREDHVRLLRRNGIARPLEANQDHRYQSGSRRRQANLLWEC